MPSKQSLYMTCGLVVYKPLLDIGKLGTNTQPGLLGSVSAVYKSSRYPLVLTQCAQDFCTACKQHFLDFQSVKRIFVHIIHIAYKKRIYLKKGII